MSPRNSLQWRLSVGLFAVIIATGVLAGAASFVWALRDANEILDGTLHDAAGLITSGRMPLPQTDAQLPGSEPDNDVLVVPLSATGRASSQLGARWGGLADGLHTVEYEGLSWRVLVTRMRASADRVAVAQQTEVRDEIALHSALRTVLPLLVLIPLLGALVRFVVRRTLAPVGRLARHVQSHAMASAAELPEVAVPAEIQPFVDSMRSLLRELTAALDQQRRFVANAAHELRSPVAALGLQAANVERVLNDAEALARLGELQYGIRRMQHLLEQLLSMARVEGAGAAPRPVLLAEVAREVLADLVPDAHARGIDLGMERCDPDLCVEATELDMRALLHNVVSNAVKYSATGSTVTLSIARDGPDAFVAVEDDGPGITPEHRLRVIEPFYRVPGTTVQGSGLGLSIVAAVAQRHGGRLLLAPGAGGRGLRVEYRQPSSNGHSAVESSSAAVRGKGES